MEAWEEEHTEEMAPWIHSIFKIAVNSRGDLEGQELDIADRAETLARSTWRWGRTVKWAWLFLLSLISSWTGDSSEADSVQHAKSIWYKKEFFTSDEYGRTAE